MKWLNRFDLQQNIKLSMSELFFHINESQRYYSLIFKLKVDKMKFNHYQSRKKFKTIYKRMYQSKAVLRN